VMKFNSCREPCDSVHCFSNQDQAEVTVWARRAMVRVRPLKISR